MAKDARPSVEAMVGRPPSMLTLTPSSPTGAVAAVRACAAACVAWPPAVAALSILPRPFRGLTCLGKLALGTLCLASRLAELLLRLPEFAFEVLQLALYPTNLALNSFDPVDRGILRGGHNR
jgi:hypothetical protein